MMLWNTRTVCNAIDVSEQAMRSKRQSLDKTKQQQQKYSTRRVARARECAFAFTQPAGRRWYFN